MALFLPEIMLDFLPQLSSLRKIMFSMPLPLHSNNVFPQEVRDNNILKQPEILIK